MIFSPTFGWTMVSSSFCRMLSSMKMCWTFWSKGSTNNGFPPRIEKVLLTHLDEKHGIQRLEKDVWRDEGHKTHMNDDVRRVMCTSQSGPESLPGPGQSWSTGTGLFLRHVSTLCLQLGSGQFPSCCSGSCPQSYWHLTEPRATRGVSIRKRHKEGGAVRVQFKINCVIKTWPLAKLT